MLKISNMKVNKIFVVLFILLVFAISSFIFYTQIRMKIANGLLGPIGVQSQLRTKQLVEEGKMIRIFFKTDVSDDQALNVMNEWKQLPNINGSSFTSSQISGKTIVDLFVVDSEKIQDVVTIIEKNVLVERVSYSLN